MKVTPQKSVLDRRAFKHRKRMPFRTIQSVEIRKMQLNYDDFEITAQMRFITKRLFDKKYYL
ncbi:hypothetical protein [Runella slithyformis]|uniref:Uncharacterized protein n=1 Tax=Runella slithyformis (strain ATCC 29530 / DSM 19594 / LMG 11500 / NCIMB 11436 / LSU 4) TaxID=761193 RepID=A0A7U4E7W6_RUNSL|nr:hypothetical protein [Runella slithyformis]AEI51078.1 hypothetical protein Runsl_4763 [Runella slithyformis DSM 19594]